ncbi:NAD(P)H-dependent flavin oxidoreductase [Pseudomonas sp. HK3]|jgi:nitronate monooxygenase
MLNGLRYPIVQAPMAGVQDEVLAAAVSNAGGLGSLPCAMLNLDALQMSLENVCKLTDKPYNLNFFAHKTVPLTAEAKQVWLDTLAPYFKALNLDATQLADGPKRQAFNQEMLNVIAPFKPSVVSFHFGLPDVNLILAIKQWGGQVWSTATTVAEAKWLAENGADAIIAQGLEAGGHRGHFLKSDLDGQLNTLPLLSAIKQVVTIPVIAAGGIVDAKTVNQAITLGAIAVQVGTAYLLCDEAKTSDIHRHILQSDDAHHTKITNVFSGRAARGIVNRAIRELGPISKNAPSFPHASDAITALRKASEAKGLGDFTPLWCGQNATGCKAVSAKALTTILAKGLNA